MMYDEATTIVLVGLNVKRVLNEHNVAFEIVGTEFTSSMIDDEEFNQLMFSIRIEENEENAKNRDMIIELLSSFNYAYCGHGEDIWSHCQDVYDVDLIVEVVNDNFVYGNKINESF